MAGLVLKPLELYNRRHAFVLVMLCYLLVVSVLSMSKACYLLLSVFGVGVDCWCPYRYSQWSLQNLTQGLWLAFKLFCQALPLMVLLYGLYREWVLCGITHSVRQGYGLANQMTPGDIAQLTKSNERVFRVSLKEKTATKHLIGAH